jgi:NADP-dependent 3-hydroxy acid dehydrogenase YdfG
MSSVAGTSGQAWLSVYAATKFVDTDMAEFVKSQVPAEEMIKPQDIAEAVRFLLRLSPAVVVPEIVFARPDEGL